MATPKASFNREHEFDPAQFNPTPEELDGLLAKARELTGREPGARFRKILFRLITLYRFRLYTVQTVPTPDEILEEEKQLRRKLLRLLDHFDDGPKSLSEHFYTDYFQAEIALDGERNRHITLRDAAHSVLEALSFMRENLEKGKQLPESQRPLTLEEVRRITVRELARAFEEELDAKPTKTRGGPFEKFVRGFLDVVRCEVKDRKLVPKVPGDLFRIVCEAIDAYPVEEPYCLLREGLIAPGLTGPDCT